MSDLFVLRKDLSAAAQLAADILADMEGDAVYTVYCPDDLCAQLELTGLGQEGELSYARAALDMNISVIHSLKREYPAYCSREAAVWASVLILAQLRNQRNAATVEKLYRELSKAALTYFAFRGDIALAAESDD